MKRLFALAVLMCIAAAAAATAQTYPARQAGMQPE